MASESKELAVVDASAVTMFERLATDPNVDVEKLQKLIEMQERIMRINAKAAFDAAFSRMWPELPEVDEKGQIKNKDGSVKSRYAKYEDIQTAVRPVLKEYGFSLRHRVEFPREGIVRVIGVLSGHGHTEESAFEAPPDKNDYRTAIQDQGSTLSYGYRYTTTALLNIITRGVDNDGQRRPEKQAPDGFADWWLDLQSAADSGSDGLADTWHKSKAEYKRHVMDTNRSGWESIKRQAAKVVTK